MEHASFDFPSHLVPLLEVGLLAAAALLWLARPAPVAAATEAVLRPFAGLGRGARPALFALLGALGSALLCGLYGPPIPRVNDELSHLLAADTLHHGRLANPPPPHPALAGRYALSSPSYASKYPLGQGILLALGQWLGSPMIGLWLGAGLLCGAAVWCFDAWLGARLATAAALLLGLRLGVGSYWNQSYWGGSVAAAGGLLVYGGVGWMRRGREREGALAVGCGGALLILTRPFEGLLVSLPALASCAGFLWSRRRARRRALLLAAAIAAPALLALGLTALHNRAVTGRALLLPHVHYERTHDIAREWVWSRFDPATGGTSFHDRPPAEDGGHGWWRVSLRHLPRRLARASYFVLGLALIPVLLLAPRPRHPGWRLATVGWLLVIAGHALVDEYFPHYSAPLVAPLYLAAFLALEGLSRRPCRSSERRSRLVRGVLFAALLSGLGSFLVQLPAHRPDPTQPSALRQRARRELAAEGGRHLVLTPGGRDLVANGADLVTAPILWAAPADPAAARRLRALYPDRQLWWFDPAVTPSLRRVSPVAPP